MKGYDRSIPVVWQLKFGITHHQVHNFKYNKFLIRVFGCDTKGIVSLDSSRFGLISLGASGTGSDLGVAKHPNKAIFGHTYAAISPSHELGSLVNPSLLTLKINCSKTGKCKFKYKLLISTRFIWSTPPLSLSPFLSRTSSLFFSESFEI